jgi:hypothetical protein
LGETIHISRRVLLVTLGPSATRTAKPLEDLMSRTWTRPLLLAAAGACLAGAPAARAADFRGFFPSRRSSFGFNDLRVQATNADGGARLRYVRNGAKFWIVMYTRFSGPARGRMVFDYTMSGLNGSELTRDSQSVNLTASRGTSVRASMDSLRLTLPQGVSERTFVINATVRMNGTLLRRSTVVTVYR